MGDEEEGGGNTCLAFIPHKHTHKHTHTHTHTYIYIYIYTNRGPYRGKQATRDTGKFEGRVSIPHGH